MAGPAAGPARARPIDEWIENGHREQMAGRHAEAMAWFRRVLERDPCHFDALQLLGLARVSVGDIDGGIQLLERALARDPAQAVVHNNLGSALLAAGRPDEAVAALVRAAHLEPSNEAVLLNLAKATLAAGRATESIAVALALVHTAPHLARSHQALGQALRAAGRSQEASAAFRRAVHTEPASPDAHLNLGFALVELGDHESARDSFAQAAGLAPAQTRSYAELLCAYSGLGVADWGGWRRALEYLDAATEPDAAAIDPLRAMHFPGTDRSLHQLTARFAMQTAAVRGGRSRPVAHARKDADRIRLGYLSPDFGDHPVTRLLASVLRHHDRDRFSVRAYAWGAGAGTPHRGLISAAVDRFVDVSALSEPALAARLRADGIDIAVDLAGYTGEARPRVFALGAAPLQVGWLGYAGTAASGALDYLLADRISVPPGSEAWFSERIVRLARGFMPYDPATVIAAAATRAEHGLPEDACVLACFGRPLKINPPLFDAWMQALQSVPNAVLWLAAPDPVTAERLRRHAAERGVTPARLIVAPRAAAQAQYLARYAHVDLALDTYPYGSHSTALDVLFAGCPLLALSGQTMASRVSASILHAAGLPELVAGSLDDYRERIVTLASDAAARGALRARVAAARSRTALFDAAAFTRSLEQAFVTMHARAAAGLPPEAFDVP